MSSWRVGPCGQGSSSGTTFRQGHRRRSLAKVRCSASLYLLTVPNNQHQLPSSGHVDTDTLCLYPFIHSLTPSPANLFQGFELNKLLIAQQKSYSTPRWAVGSHCSCEINLNQERQVINGQIQKDSIHIKLQLPRWSFMKNS